MSRLPEEPLDKYILAKSTVETTPPDQVELKLLRLLHLKVKEAERPYELFREESKKLPGEVKVMEAKIKEKADVAFQGKKVLRKICQEIPFSVEDKEFLLSLSPLIRKTLSKFSLRNLGFLIENSPLIAPCTGELLVRFIVITAMEK